MVGVLQEVFSLAHSRSAKKRVRLTEKRRNRNRAFRSTMNTTIKKFENALKSGEHTEQQLSQTMKSIDKTAARGIIHRNAAARRKSRLMKAARAIRQAE